jgi:hypothetical protein
MNDREAHRDRTPTSASASAIAPASEGPGAHVTLERALLELELVHRLEQARLLRMACRLASRCALGDRDGVALARWRRQCARALGAARADGSEPPAALHACARREPEAWPSARSLALASLELDDCRAGRRLARR